MGQILAFDRNARCHADLSRDAILRRCRLAATCAGCNNAQRLAVQSFGERLLDEGLDAHTVIVRAESMAKMMARPEPVLGA